VTVNLKSTLLLDRYPFPLASFSVSKSPKQLPNIEIGVKGDKHMEN